MERADRQLLRVVLHPSHPRGVPDALRALDAIELIEPTEDAVAGALEVADVLVTYIWHPDYLSDRLRWIQSISAGIAQFPTGELERAGVVLTSASGVHGPQVAEHVFALLLALTRLVGVSMRDTTGRVWRPRMAHEIGGRTMAILGLGAIGEEVASRAKAWGINVIGIKSQPDRYNGTVERVGGPDDMLGFCGEADIVVCVLPESGSTRGLIGAEALAAIGPGWFINVGRGSVLDEGALLRALDDGELRGAGLDVFLEEPLPESSPLWDHPRVVITPHLAGMSPHYGERLAALFETNRGALEGGAPWKGRVV